MKNLAKLILCFSLLFVLLFLAAVLHSYFASWIDMARTIPLGNEPGKDAAGLAWKALPVALYLSILLALSYTARRKMPVPLGILCIIVLGCAFAIVGSLGISQAEVLNFALKPVSPVEGRPGLILSRLDNNIILLKGTGDVRGPRVVSIPGQPLIYQEAPIGPNNTILSLPPLPFADNTPWFIRSLEIDFNLGAREMESRLETDFFSFAIYVFSLILLLSSFRSLLDFSKWPLANLFLGAMVFRLILSLETFLNTSEINALISAFLADRFPPMLITPLVFTALGVLIIIYTLLTSLVRPRRVDDGQD